MKRGSPPKHRHDGTSPLPLGMDWSPPPKKWDGRNTVWPHDPHSGWSYFVMVPSWIVQTESKASNDSLLNPIVFYRIQVGIQSPEGVSSIHGILHRFSDFLKLHSALKRAFPKKDIPPAPPKHALLRINSSRLLLEERRRALEEWMGKLLSDIDLSRSALVVSFLELEVAARSSFQDMNQLSLETDHLGEASQPERSGSGGSLVGSSAVASMSHSVMSEFGSDSAYETSDIGTSNQTMIHVSETVTEAMASFYDSSDPIGEISNGDLMGESVFNRPGEFLRINSQHRKENLALGSDSFNANPSRERIQFMPEQDLDKLSGHSRKLSAESIGSDISSLRGSELSVPGVANSIWDDSVDYTAREARSAIEAVSSMEAQFLNNAQIILPLDQQHKLNRVLVTMQRRLVAAKTDMEDLIARLNQEMTVKEYLTTKVKDLEGELEVTKQKSKENLQQAILIERERVTQTQWDMDELHRKYLDMESKLKIEQCEKSRAESEKSSVSSENDYLDLDMPPRTLKRGGGSAGKKTPARGARGKAAASATAAAVAAAEEVATVEESVSVEEVKVTEIKEDTRVEEIKIEEEKRSIEESKANGSVDTPDAEDVKESYEEDRGERLELEDNEPEYEAEEETVVDYDERDMEHADGHELEGDEAEEDVDEGDMDDEEEAEMADEEMEDGLEDAVGEEAEGEEEGHNGDEEEHHQVVKEHRKRKEFEVFVGGLDKDATEDDLKKVFSAVGEITEVRLMMNPQTKKNKGFAFLRFATVEQAKRAISELKAPVVNGKQCGVAPSQDSDTLFVGNICKTWTKEHLKEKLKNFGIENIEDLTLVEDTNNEGMNRGFAFLEFSSRSEAMEAFRCLQKRDVFFGTERNVKVSFADSFIEPDDEIMAQVITVFIDGLPAAWDEDRVKEYLKKYGQVVKIELARNMPSAKRKDFGFVTFDTHDNAVACAEGINNKELGEGDNKVKVRARLSRPQQKGRVNRGIRGEIRIGRGVPRGGRISYSHRPPPRRYPGRGTRPISSRGPPISSHVYKRPIPYREKRPFTALTERPRRLPPPERSYERRPPVPVYPKSSTKREYSRRDVPPPSRRPIAEYAPRVPIERRSAYRDEYSGRGSGYTDIPPRSAPRAPDRRAYAEEGYGRKLERPPPSYRETRSREARDYDSLSGSKRLYSELDDVPRYADVSVRQSRARLEYGLSSNSAQYSDAYGERLGRSHMGYGSSRSSLSSQDGLYSGRQGMGYGGGSVSGNDVGGMYSSSYSSSYLPRGSDVGGSSYSSLYSSRSLSDSGYLGGSGSGSYY